MLQFLYREDALEGQLILEWNKDAQVSLVKYQEHEKNKKLKQEDAKDAEPVDEHIDFEDRDEVLEVVGIAQREQFLKSTKVFIEHLEKASSDEDSSASSSSSSEEDDKQKGKSQQKKPAQAPAAAK